MLDAVDGALSAAMRRARRWRLEHLYGRQGAAARAAALLLVLLLAAASPWLSLRSQQRALAERRRALFRREPGVTLALHATLDRAPALELTLRRWPGPVALAMMARSPEDVLEITAWLARVRARAPQRRVRHAVLVASPDDAPLGRYPINVLRNLAWQQAETEFVLVLDADLVPDAGLHAALERRARWLRRQVQQADTAFVLPTFQWRSNSTLEEGPSDAAALRAAVASDRAMPMYADRDPVPHMRVTDYPRWLRREEDGGGAGGGGGAAAGGVVDGEPPAYTVAWQELWEPYVVVERDNTPMFDERFVGYGKDKLQHVNMLHRLGYRFIVLREHFLFHHNHAFSSWKETDYEATTRRAEALMELWQAEWHGGGRCVRR